MTDPAVPAGTAAAARPGLGAVALLLAVGALSALGQAPWGFWPVTLGALALLIGRAAHAPGRLFLLGWAFGAGQAGAAMHWIVEPFLVDLDRHGWMAPFGFVFHAAGFGLFPGVALWLGARLGRDPAGRLVAIPVALTAAEVLRMHLFTGFPWAAAGQVWIDTPLIAAAALGGPHLLDLLTYGAAAALAAAALAAAPPRRAALAAIASVPLLLGWVLGQRHLDGIPAAAEDAPVIRLVQPDAAQHLKWQADMAPVFASRLLEASAAPGEPAIVLWPETALPYWLTAAPGLLAEAREGAGAPLLIGALRQSEAGSRNSAALIGAGGAVEEVYDKHHLVPFGEFIPLGRILSRFGIAGLADLGGTGFAAGPGPRAIDTGAAGRAAILICYEAVFPRSLDLPGRPDWIAQLTNDAWFGTGAGPEQHLAQARLRAAERGLPLARAANTGITAMIDAGGRVTAALPPRRPGHLDAALPPPIRPTPYARTGDLPILVLLAAFLGGLALRARRAIDPGDRPD